VVDLGSSKGAADGNVVELWRPFKLRHPVTGQTLTDRFRIGSLRLVQVRKTLAFARPEGKLARAAAPGDVVILTVAPSPQPSAGEQVPAKARLVTPEGPGPGAPPAKLEEASTEVARAEVADGEARELSAIFESLKGQSPATRIARYEQYVRAHPQGKYARVLYEEAITLRAIAGARPTGDARSKSNSPHPTFNPPQSALAANPLTIGVEMPAGAGAVLHVRHAGELAYQSLPMGAAGAGYFRTTIRGEQMKAPEVEYFIESVDDTGRAAPLVGTAEAPQHIEVNEVPRPEPPANPAASVALFTDYADYNRLRRNDYAWQTEGYFGLRYGDVGVRAVRSGFGVYRGVGGSIQELDELGLSGRKVGLTYGYLEGEFGSSVFVGLIGRVVLGLTDDGVNGGGQFFVRLGNDKRTNLLLGGEVLGGIGLKGIAELQWNTIPRIPIVMRTEVTDQPAGSALFRPLDSNPNEPSRVSTGPGDVGARAMLQVGYRVVPSLTLAVRGSYEGRTIQHAGPGAGAGVTYTW
jgi:hypothetical protein